MKKFLLVSALLLPALFAQSAKIDLTGTWSRGGGREKGGPHTQWSPDKLPFTPAGQAQFNANKPGKGPRQVPPAFGNDPVGDANPPGLYRTLIYNRPFEMIQMNGKILQVFEWGKTWRTIWIDGRPVPDDVPAGPYWYGHSVAKWEGNTLVVQTVALDERQWLDEWGTPFSADARIEERWRSDGNKLELILTMHDPAMYQKPWSSDPKMFTLTPSVELQEMIFAPIDEKEFNKRVRDAAAGVKR